MKHKFKKFIRRCTAMVIIIAMLVAFVPFADLNLSVNAADVDRSGYKSTYGVSYEELFRKYPEFLNHGKTTDYYNYLYSQFSAARDEYSTSDENMASYWYSLKEGSSYAFNELLACLGIGDTTGNKCLDNVTMTFMKDFLSTKTPILDQAIKAVTDDYKDFQKIYDLTSKSGQMMFVEALQSMEKNYTADEIKKMSDVIFEDSNNFFKNMKTAAEYCQAALTFYELQRIDKAVLEQLISVQTDYDSPLYLGLCRLRKKQQDDIVDYFKKYWANEKAKSIVSDLIKKSDLGRPEVLLVNAAIKVAFLIANPVTADKLIETSFAESFVDSWSAIITNQKMYFYKNYATDLKIDAYEKSFNAYIAANKVALDYAIQIKKDKQTGGLEVCRNSLNSTSYDNYIKACLGNVAKCIQEGSVAGPNNRPIIGQDTVTVKDNTETILSRFKAIQAQYPPNVNCTYTDNWGGAIQCFGFARMVFSKLFGCEMPYAYMNAYRYKYVDNNNVVLIGQLEEGNVTVDNLKTLLAKAKLGDIIQASGVTQHTMMVVSVNDIGVEVYDCNWKTSTDQPDCVINQHVISYEYLSERYNQHNDKSAAGFSLYRAANYANVTGDGTYVFYDDSANFQIENGVLVKYNGWQRDVVIPDTVTAIGDSAFYGNKYIRSVYIPDGVTSIGSRAFKNCVNLYRLTMPDSLETIGSEAFYNCTSLLWIDIP